MPPPAPVAEARLPDAGDRHDEVPGEIVYATKVLGKLIAYLAARPGSTLLDLGIAIGSNIRYFTEQVGCRMVVADLAGEIERHGHGGDDHSLARALDEWFTQRGESVDGVLCWDMFDYLPAEPASIVARQVTRVLAPNGLVFGMFRTTAPPLHHYTRHLIVDESHVRHQPYGSPSRKVGVLSNRDIIRLFTGLRVSESFLLKTNVHEVLFRKPEYLVRRGR